MSRVDERVQILRRLRRYLEEQRDRFLSYLHLLDEENAVIRRGDVDRLQHHVELEQSIIGDIVALQRAIDPLEVLYGRAYPRPERTILPLKTSLQRLRETALARNEENRQLLRDRLESLRLEIKELARRGKPVVSPFARIGEPKLIDIRS